MHHISKIKKLSFGKTRTTFLSKISFQAPSGNFCIIMSLSVASSFSKKVRIVLEGGVTHVAVDGHGFSLNSQLIH